MRGPDAKGARDRIIGAVRASEDERDDVRQREIGTGVYEQSAAKVDGVSSNIAAIPGCRAVHRRADVANHGTGELVDHDAGVRQDVDAVPGNPADPIP